MSDLPSSPSPQRTVSKPSGASKPKRKGGILNKLLLLGVIVAIGLFAWAEQQRRSVEKRLEQTEQQLQEIQKSTQRSGQEVAKEVLEKVRRHMDVPNDPEPTVATIVDVNRLRESSDFYDKAENGDHLIITANRAILYDPDRDVVIDVVPVQVNQQANGSPGASPAGSPAPVQSPGAAPAGSPAAATPPG